MYNYFKRFMSRGICKKCENKVKYLNGRIESLTKSIGESLIPVEIKNKATKTIKPYKIHNINTIVADSEYDTFSFNNWRQLLTDVYNNVKSQEKYTKNVFDCDDFALVFSGLITYSAFKSGFKNQLAFGIAWSKVHAFNIFIDDRNNAYIYEPQNNQIMVYDDAIKNKSYKVTKIWFLS